MLPPLPRPGEVFGAAVSHLIICAAVVMNKPDRAQQKVRVFLKDGTLLTTLDLEECMKRPAGTEPVSVPASAIAIPDIGTKMADGSVFAGLTADGKQQIYAMPADLDVTLAFNDAAKQVRRLNAEKALGHDDWVIPTQQQLSLLQQNQDEGALKGTFRKQTASGSDLPDWYWSSTENRLDPSYVWDVRFSDGYGDWLHKDFNRLSCRPVRLVACEAPSSASHSAPAPG
jgi:hypothetical protein